MDIRTYNREAWNQEVERRNEWTVPVSSEVIEAARRGEWSIVLTPTKPVPRSWFPETLKGLDVLCLASGGGQQAPVLAAVGARVTLLDNSPRQLAQDRLVADRDDLQLVTIEGDMRDLSAFADESFDLVFHPASNLFVPDVRPVWREAFRVLRRGGILLAGFMNPAAFIFDDEGYQKGEFIVRHSLPYSDVTSLTDEERKRYTEKQEPLVFGHTLEDQLGGQLEAGFVIAGFFEDIQPELPIAKFMPTLIATKAIKP
jgi:SAM-dependent methyltransferase